MTCPDDERLDYWLDEALPTPEAAALAAHVADCSPCADRHLARLTEDRSWRAALALDGADLAYLARANLAAAWLRGPLPAARPATASWWPALVLLGAVAAYGAWATAMPLLGEGTGWLSRLGVLGIFLAWLVSSLLAGATALGEALDNPLLGDPTAALAAASFALWVFVTRPWALARPG
jgi:hypothetical protein